jgi:hypothetical protein
VGLSARFDLRVHGINGRLIEELATCPVSHGNCFGFKAWNALK